MPSGLVNDDGSVWQVPVVSGAQVAPRVKVLQAAGVAQQEVAATSLVGLVRPRQASCAEGPAVTVVATSQGRVRPIVAKEWPRQQPAGPVVPVLAAVPLGLRDTAVLPVVEQLLLPAKRPRPVGSEVVPVVVVAASKAVAPSADWRMSAADRRVCSAPATGRRRGELEADARAARVAYFWLLQVHSDWFEILAGKTGIAPGAGLEAAMIHGLMLSGASYLDKGRCTVERYGRWARARGAQLVGGGYPPSAATVAWFVTDETDDYRDVVAKRDELRDDGIKSRFKGKTAEALVKALAYAHEAFSAPFPPSVLKHRMVALAAVPPPDCDFELEEEAHMSMWLCLFHNELAKDGSRVGGREICPVARAWARVMVFLEVNGLRTVEGLRSRWAKCDGAAGEARFRCAGGKPRRMVAIKPFEDLACDEGFEGVLCWFWQWVAQLVGKEYMMRAFKVRKGGTFLFDAAWDGDHAADSSHVRLAWYAFGEAEPHSVSPALMKERRCSPYATRHVVQDVTRDQGWDVDERNELNRWAALPRKADAAGPASGVAARATVALRRRPVIRYSSGNASLDKRLALRLEALRLVQGFLARSGGVWREALPRQVGDQATFAFLREQG